MAEAGNQLRMPFAEWLFRMAEAKLPLPGRMLAIHAAVFDIVGNESLAEMSGLSSSTLNRWKKQLKNDGWVIIRPCVGGRGVGVKIDPAYRETPITFTDISPRNPSRFNPRICDKTPITETMVSSETPVRKPPVLEQTTVTETEVSRARVEDNNIYNNTLQVEKEKKEREEKEVDLGADAPPSPYDALSAFEAYNALAQRIGLPIARTLTPQRRKSLVARLREHGGMDAWAIVLGNIEKSAFLRGNNPRGWTVNFDFLLQAASFSKVVDGTYGNGAHASQSMPQENYVERMRRLMGKDAAPVCDVEILPPEAH